MTDTEPTMEPVTPPGVPALVALTEAVNRLTESMAVFRVQQDMILHGLDELRAEVGIGAPDAPPTLKYYEQAVVEAMHALGAESAPAMTIAEGAGYSERRVRDILKGLAQKGVVRRVNRSLWCLKAEEVA